MASGRERWGPGWTTWSGEARSARKRREEEEEEEGSLAAMRTREEWRSGGGASHMSKCVGNICTMIESPVGGAEEIWRRMTTCGGLWACLLPEQPPPPVRLLAPDTDLRPGKCARAARQQMTCSIRAWRARLNGVENSSKNDFSRAGGGSG